MANRRATERDLLVRIRPKVEIDEIRIQDQVVDVFRGGDGPLPEVRRVETVGAQVGEELVEKGGSPPSSRSSATR
jgi:preprotein translocase subunit SecF